MKKFISFVMAGAMVASLVPATAFAKGEVTATAKVIDALELTKDEAKATPEIKNSNYEVPEIQLKISDVDYRTSGSTPSVDVEFTLDNAEFLSTSDSSLLKLISIKDDNGNPVVGTVTGGTEAVEEHYTDTEADPAGTIMVKASKVGDDKVFMDDIKVIPDFDEIPAKTVEDLYSELIADGYIVTVTPVYDDATKSYTAGKVAKSGSIVDLTELEPTTLITVADQETDWIAENAAGYTRCTGTHVAATTGSDGTGAFGTITVEVKEKDDDSVTFKFKGEFKEDYVIAFKLESKLTKSSEGTKATVSVDSKMVTVDDLVYASVLGAGLKASIKKTVDVAEDEVVTLNSNGLKIETAVGTFATGQVISLKLSKGFEFVKNSMGEVSNDYATVTWVDDNEIELKVTSAGAGEDELVLKGTKIEATTAKSGTVATITVKSNNNDSASVEVAKVVDYKVSLTVDEDEDLPVIYSGVNVGNDGITDDSDHLSLEVTAEETFAGAWSMRQGFNFNLPDGVYVTDVKISEVEGFYQNRNEVGEDEWKKAFEDAYQDGDHKNFEFDKRVFDDVDYTLDGRDEASVTFQLELVADPTFEGDVKLTFEGPLVDKQEVTIAKFVKPYTVKAEQNDLVIDYRNTAIPTPIVITEAEEGLWEKGASFTFGFDKDDVMEFEDDATFEIDADSELDIKDDTKKGTLTFTIKEESDSAATVTIKDMELFMSRNIPAGAYDLEISTSLEKAYLEESLFAPDEPGVSFEKHDDDKESFVDDVADYSKVVKEAFVNVVTSGRDKDNLFTTKVVVPVGEAYIVAGESQVTLDVPAYISAAGYTMLPVRAVSKALGVDTNNVLWNAETRTITIMYAQRIITMTVGVKTVYVNGSAIPTSAAPEIKDGRAFLPLRDLGTALGVTNVTWDAATKTATLN